MANKITYNIGFNVDSSGLKQVQAELQKMSNLSVVDIKLINPDLATRDINKIKDAAKKASELLQNSFNVKLDSYDLKKFNQELQKSPGLMNSIRTELIKLGPTGKIQLNNLTKEILTMNTQVRQTSKVLDDLGKTFMNTLRWSVASSALNAISGSIQQAWGYTKKLDASLNDIRIVTGKSADEMERFAKQANKAAKSLGASTTAYTNASLIYYQQGLGEEDVQARSNVTLKAANVTGQSAAEVSQQLTAVWNGYKVVAEEAELYVDKLAAVAATTAADLEELSDGMSKVASAANTMGVDIDQLSAQLATIVSVTRQDASLVGTALKTIYARMGDLKVSGVDEFGTSLGDVSGQMRQMGIEVLDQEGNLRDMGEVIEEVAAKWGTWTDAQQQAAAVAIAGKRQYNNLIALFENWNMYESALNTSQTSEGTLQKQQETYMDSLEAHLNQLSVASEKLYDALIDNDAIKGFIDLLTGVVNIFGDITAGVGGAIPMLLSLGGVLGKIFNAQLSNGIKAIGGGIKIALGIGAEAYGMKHPKEAAREQIAREMGWNPDHKMTETEEKMVDIQADKLKVSKYLTEEQKKQFDLQIKIAAEKGNELERLKAEQKILKDETDEIEKRAKAYVKDGRVSNPNTFASKLRTEQANINKVKTDFTTSDFWKNKDELADTTGTEAETGIVVEDRKGFKDKTETELKDYAKSFSPDSKAAATMDTLIKVKQQETQIFQSLGDTGTKAYKELQEWQEKFYKGEIDATTYTKKMAEALNSAEKEAGELAVKIVDVSEASDKMKQDINDATVAVEQADNAYNDFKADTEKGIKINQITETISSLTAFAGACMSIANIFKIVQDESLSTEEKVEQVIFAILGAIAAAIPAVVSMLTMLQTKANIALGWIGLILMAISLVTTLIISLSQLPKPETELEKANKALEQAKEAAEKAKQAVADLQAEYEQLKETIADYKDAKLAIDELRVGTEEWRQAVQELNFQVLELVSKYEELAPYLTSENISGQIVYSIKQEGFDELYKFFNTQIKAANFYAAATKIQQVQKQREKTDKERQSSLLDPFIKNLYNNYNNAYGISELGDGNYRVLLSAADPNASDTNGWVHNDQAKFLVQALESLGVTTTGEQQSNDPNTTTTIYTEFSLPEDFLSTMGKTAEQVAEQQAALNWIKNQDIDLYNQLIAIQSGQLNYEEQIAKELEAIDSTTVQMLERLAEEKGIDPTVYSKLVKDDVINNVKDISTFYPGYFDTKTVGEEWVGDKFNTRDDAAAGRNATVKMLDELYGKGNYSTNVTSSMFRGQMRDDAKNITIVVNGEEKTIGEIEQEFAIKKYKDSISEAGSVAQIEGRLGELAKNNIDQNLAFFATDTNTQLFSDAATLSNLDSLKKLAETWEGKTYTYIDENGDEQTATFDFDEFEFDEDSAESFASSFISTLTKYLGEGFNRSQFSLFTEEDAKLYNTNLITASFLGEGAQSAITSLFAKIAHDPELTKQVNDLIAQTNWNDTGSVQQLRASLLDLGVDITDIGPSWDEFIEKVTSGTKQWITNSQQVIDNLATINSLLKDISIGDIISDEDMKKLLTIEPILKNAFIRTAEGWQALMSGDYLTKQAKAQYQDLAEIKQAYNDILWGANEYGPGDATLDVSTMGRWDLLEMANKHAAGYLVQHVAGIDQKTFENTANTLMTAESDSTEYLAAEKLMKNWMDQINQAALDAQDGYYDSQMAEEIFISSIASNWKDIDAKWSFLSESSQKKAKQLWNSRYLEELGFGGELVDFLNDKLDPSTLESRIEDVRKLELNYLQEIEAKVQKLDVALERAFGIEKLDLMKEYIKLQEKNLSVASTQKDIAYDEYIASGQDILKYYAGAQSYIDPVKGITDLEGLLNYISTLTEEEKQNFQAYLNKYQQSLDLEQQYIEASWQIVDRQIEIFESEQNMTREFREFEKEWAQNINKLKNINFDGLAAFTEDFSRDFKTSFENLTFGNNQWNSTWNNEVDYLTKLQTAVATNEATLANGEKNPFWNEAKGELDAAKAQEAISEQLDTMYEQYEDLYDEANALYDSIRSAGEEINALYDEQINKLNSANDLLASSIDLYKLVGKGIRGSADDIKAYSELINVNAMDAVNYAQTELLAQKRLYAEAVAKGDQEAIEAYAQSQADAAAKYAETLQNAFNTVAEQFGIQLEAAIDEAIGEGGLQAFSDAWELEKTYDSAYLDNINAEYAMYEFNRNVQKSIDETDNIVAQNKLIEMRQKQEARLNAIIAERGRLSQHEIDLANAEYELTLKQIALEEAQQTANTMKLTRDAFGNYSYQYVADENKIADAEAEVKAAENELYNLRKEHEKELIDNFGAYLTDYQTQRAEAVAAGNDALVKALDEKYLGENGLLTNLQSEVLSLGDGTGLFVGQLDTIANMNFDNLKANIDSLTSSTKTQLDEITNTINSSIGSGDFIGAATTLANTATDLNTLTEDAEKIIGTFSSSVDKLSEVVGKLDNAASVLTTKANAAIGKYGDAVNENAIANNYDIENIDINLADGNFINTINSSEGERASTGSINISNFIDAINDKIADYFNSMSESLQNNDITRVLGNATEAIEENTEAIKNLTEELKDELNEPVVIVAPNAGTSNAPILDQKPR